MDQPAFTLAQVLDRAISDYKAGKYAETELVCEQLVVVKPDFFEAHYVLATVQAKLEKNDAALASFDRALALRPNHAIAHFNRANALQQMKRQEEALASYDRAIELRPDFVMAYSNRGNILQKAHRYEEAIANYDRAIALQPGFAIAHYNRGNALQHLNRDAEAIACFDQAIALQPDLAHAHLNRGFSHLIMGNFDRGWPGYEWRMEVPSPGNSKRSFAQPQWVGRNDISGKTIYLHAEQGFGDTMQFCRYVPLVAARGAHVVLEVPKPLIELMGTLAGPSQIVCKGDPVPACDFQCPLPSLPLAFGTRLETIPAAVPYLSASPQAIAEWDSRLGPKQRPRIGLAWSGEVTFMNYQKKRIPLSGLLALLDVDATFVSLQKDVGAEDATVLQSRSDLRHFGDDLKSFADTAALISNLDLVVSIDTSVVHLAGALAKSVWVLLPYNADWRWMHDREDSLWYPSARLFRQDGTRTWDGVIVRVRDALREFVQSRA